MSDRRPNPGVTDTAAAAASLRRGQLLLTRRRPELAERELRQALVDRPDHAVAHALLGLCLGELGRLSEATAEAEQGVHLAPANAYVHYVLAWVRYKRRRLEDADQAIAEALRLNPQEPLYFAHLAAIRYDQHRWQAALEAAEHGLQLDPEHASCSNLRAMALLKLGRGEEARLALASALARQPENAATHANQGWALLHAGQADQALAHFREALRLDPTSAWARSGTVEALKARHRLYALLLRYFLWRSRQSSRTRWAATVLVLLALRVLVGAALLGPGPAVVAVPLLAVGLGFVALTWLGDPLYTLALRADPAGRLVVTAEQVARSNWVALMLLGAAVGGLVVGWRSGAGDGLLAAAAWGALIVPLLGIWRCRAGWPRRTLLALLVLDALGTTGATLATALEPGRPSGTGLLLLAIVVTVFVGWSANLLALARVRR